jgi:hypothetical protein
VAFDLDRVISHGARVFARRYFLRKPKKVKKAKEQMLAINEALISYHDPC